MHFKSTFAVVWMAALCCLASAAALGAEGRPNVILILADDLGYGDTTCFGGKDVRTPNIDEIVNGGMRLDPFYANCPVCSPSRASLMSGRFPDLVGVPGVIRTNADDSWGYLSPSAILLPAVLKKAGYHTGIVGKWHLGLEPENTPNARGFDHFHGFLGDMMDDYRTHRRQGHNYMRLNDNEIDPPGHATDLFTQWAIDYVHERTADAKSGKQPFFLYLAYNAPHNPIQPTDEWLAKVKQREAGISAKRAPIVALIEHLDDGIGKVMAALKDAGLDENTLVLFTSDNGGDMTFGASNGPLRGTKGTMYEGGIREPMGARWPGHIAAGSTGAVIAMHMDLMPTICEAAGTAPPPGIEGKSILSVLLGKEAGADFAKRPLYYVRREGALQYNGLTIQAIRQGDWKLVHNSPFGPLELFNLKDDPKEEHDMSTKNPKMKAELARLIRLQTQKAGAVPWQKPAKAD